MDYTCSLPAESPSPSWECSLEHISYQPPYYEAVINGNGFSFHVITGPQINGNFLCIPNCQIGCELSRLSDVFWNSGQLLRHLNETDTRTVAVGLSYLPEIGKSLVHKTMDPIHFLKRLPQSAIFQRMIRERTADNSLSPMPIQKIRTAQNSSPNIIYPSTIIVQIV